MHGRVRPFAAAVLLQSRDDVGRMLVTELRNAVVRISVPIVVDAVAPVAGVELLLARCRIAGGMRAQRPTQGERRACKQAQAIQSRKHLILRATGSKWSADVKEWAGKLPLAL